ncbi:MAG: exodeoxyribonuclease III [Planctomycetes bacterium]|nr:exodeoxyribonuclease III [Planctomycetota bacterium]
MRCVSWNVNGLRAVAGKGFVDWLASTAPDLCCVQETKALPSDLPPALSEPVGYRLRLHPAIKKGYSGVGIYVRDEPDEWFEGLGDARFDDEGRFLAARYGKVLVASVYFPNSQEKGARIEYRLAFGDALCAFLAAQRRKKRHIVLGGDFNVAHEELDLARPKDNSGNPGFLPQERAWMSAFLAGGHADVWRERNPSTVGYSWWSMRTNARAKNIGWRLDYFCVDRAFAPRVTEASISPEILGSDHCPVTIGFD